MFVAVGVIVWAGAWTGGGVSEDVKVEMAGEPGEILGVRVSNALSEIVGVRGSPPKFVCESVTPIVMTTIAHRHNNTAAANRSQGKAIRERPASVVPACSTTGGGVSLPPVRGQIWASSGWSCWQYGHFIFSPLLLSPLSDVGDSTIKNVSHLQLSLEVTDLRTMVRS